METNLFTEVRDVNSVKNASGLKGRFVVSYIGTLGLAHGLRTVLEAAAQLQKNFPKILFQFVGEGADKERLIKFVQDLGLKNILFRPQQPRENIPSIISASDICLVLLKKAEVFKTVIPTKMLEFMACARPVILGVDGQARKVLVDMAGAGVFIKPEDPVALSDAIIKLYQNAALRKALGHNGRNYILKHLTRETTAKAYIKVLKKTIG